MSLAQFDDILEICCEYMALDEKVRKDMAKNDKVEFRNDWLPEGYKWWEHAVGEIDKESEFLETLSVSRL